MQRSTRQAVAQGLHIHRDLLCLGTELGARAATSPSPFRVGTAQQLDPNLPRLAECLLLGLFLSERPHGAALAEYMESTSRSAAARGHLLAKAIPGEAVQEARQYGTSQAVSFVSRGRTATDSGCS